MAAEQRCGFQRCDGVPGKTGFCNNHNHECMFLGCENRVDADWTFCEEKVNVHIRNYCEELDTKHGTDVAGRSFAVQVAAIARFKESVEHKENALAVLSDWFKDFQCLVCFLQSNERQAQVTIGGVDFGFFMEQAKAVFAHFRLDAPPKPEAPAGLEKAPPSSEGPAMRALGQRMTAMTLEEFEEKLKRQQEELKRTLQLERQQDKRTLQLERQQDKRTLQLERQQDREYMEQRIVLNQKNRRLGSSSQATFHNALKHDQLSIDEPDDQTPLHHFMRHAAKQAVCKAARPLVSCVFYWMQTAAEKGEPHMQAIFRLATFRCEPGQFGAPEKGNSQASLKDFEFCAAAIVNKLLPETEADAKKAAAKAAAAAAKAAAAAAKAAAVAKGKGNQASAATAKTSAATAKKSAATAKKDAHTAGLLALVAEVLRQRYAKQRPDTPQRGAPPASLLSCIMDRAESRTVLCDTHSTPVVNALKPDGTFFLRDKPQDCFNVVATVELKPKITETAAAKGQVEGLHEELFEAQRWHTYAYTLLIRRSQVLLCMTTNEDNGHHLHRWVASAQSVPDETAFAFHAEELLLALMLAPPDVLGAKLPDVFCQSGAKEGGSPLQLCKFLGSGANVRAFEHQPKDGSSCVVKIKANHAAAQASVEQERDVLRALADFRQHALQAHADSSLFEGFDWTAPYVPELVDVLEGCPDGGESGVRRVVGLMVKPVGQHFTNLPKTSTSRATHLEPEHVRQLVCITAILHSCGFAHCDLATRNFFFVMHEGKRHVMVNDLGNAAKWLATQKTKFVCHLEETPVRLLRARVRGGAEYEPTCGDDLQTLTMSLYWLCTDSLSQASCEPHWLLKYWTETLNETHWGSALQAAEQIDSFETQGTALECVKQRLPLYEEFCKHLTLAVLSAGAFRPAAADDDLAVAEEDTGTEDG